MTHTIDTTRTIDAPEEDEGHFKRSAAWLSRRAPLFTGTATDELTNESLHGRLYVIPALGASAAWWAIGMPVTKAGLCQLIYLYCMFSVIALHYRSRRRVDTEWDLLSASPTFLSIGPPAPIRRVLNRHPRAVLTRHAQCSKPLASLFWRGLRVPAIIMLLNPITAVVVLCTSAVTPRAWVLIRQVQFGSGRTTTSRWERILDRCFWW